MLGKINGEDMCLSAGCSLIWKVELGIVSEVILQNLLSCSLEELMTKYTLELIVKLYVEFLSIDWELICGDGPLSWDWDLGNEPTKKIPDF